MIFRFCRFFPSGRCVAAVARDGRENRCQFARMKPVNLSSRRQNKHGDGVTLHVWLTPRWGSSHSHWTRVPAKPPNVSLCADVSAESRAEPSAQPRAMQTYMQRPTCLVPVRAHKWTEHLHDPQIPASHLRLYRSTFSSFLLLFYCPSLVPKSDPFSELQPLPFAKSVPRTRATFLGFSEIAPSNYLDFTVQTDKTDSQTALVRRRQSLDLHVLKNKTKQKKNLQTIKCTRLSTFC